MDVIYHEKVPVRQAVKKTADSSVQVTPSAKRNEFKGFRSIHINHKNRQTMKKSLFLAASGIAGVLLCTPCSTVHADPGPPPGYAVENRRPNFIYLDDYGFAVSQGWTYDVIRYGKTYFVFRNGLWYKSQSFSGPWFPVRNRYDLPRPLRMRSWHNIMRRRDIEYRKHDRPYRDRNFDDPRGPFQGANPPDAGPGPNMKPGGGPGPGPNSKPGSWQNPDQGPQPQGQPNGPQQGRPQRP